MSANEKLMVALDVDTFDEARILIDTLSPVVEIFKVGPVLFTACGPVVVRHILARDKRVFLDLKFHDIPNTVARAVSSAIGLARAVHDVVDNAGKKKNIKRGIFMLTLHTQGGEEMLKAAVKAAEDKSKELGIEKPLMVGVTVLTSEEKSDKTLDLVIKRAKLADKCGLDGVVASSQETQSIRKELGDDFVIVTPGIRPKGADTGDQKRVSTPKEAIRQGSSFLVVGRPIVEAQIPLEAAKQVIEEIKATR